MTHKQLTGKIPLSLVPPELIEYVGRLRQWAEEGGKYPPGSWKNVSKQEALDAVGRHWLEIVKGKEIDPETDLPHMAAIACNAGFWLHQHDKEEPGIEAAGQEETPHALREPTCAGCMFSKDSLLHAWCKRCFNGGTSLKGTPSLYVHYSNPRSSGFQCNQCEYSTTDSEWCVKCQKKGGQLFVPVDVGWKKERTP